MNIGYRVVSFSLESLQAKTLMNEMEVDLNKGALLNSKEGIFLGTSEDFCEYYTGCSDDHDVILTYEYDDNDILRGEKEGGSEILVRQANLVDAKFHDEFMNQYYGYLLSSESPSREKEMGEPISTVAGKKAFVVRTMPEQCNSILPMDYMYVLERNIKISKVMSVLNNYEEGEECRSRDERILMKTLEHAVTSAIYQGNNYRIVVAEVPANQVFHATNPGEFFYGGKEPAHAQTIMMVDHDGNPSISPMKKQEREPEGPRF